MIFANPYWGVRTKLELLARWLIVHSIIYYEIGTSIVPDSMWDANAKQYVEIASGNPQDEKQSKWHYAMQGFDSSTGFHLFKRLNRKDKKRLLHIAEHLVYEHGDKSLVIDKRKRKY